MYNLKPTRNVVVSTFAAVIISSASVASNPKSLTVVNKLDEKKFNQFDWKSNSDRYETKTITHLEVIFDKNSAPKYLDPISLSEKLRVEFGFNVKEWVAILGVARETFYKWKKKPDTEINSSVEAKIRVLDVLYNEMDKSHRKYLSNLAFGRYSNSELAKKLSEKSLTVEDVLNLYDKHYFDLEGMYKRSLA